MKIILVGTAYPHRGGIAHFNALLYKNLTQRGHQVKIVSFRRQYPGLLFPGKTQFDTSAAARPVAAEPLIDSINPVTWYQTAQKIREHAPDGVVFQHWQPFFAPCYGAIAKQVKGSKGARTLAICHNMIPHENKIIDAALSRFFIRQVDRFIVLSQAVADDLLRFKRDAIYQIVAHPVYEIFADTSLSKAEAKERLGLPDRPVVLFFGYIRAYKGLHILLEAFARIIEQSPAILVVAGEFYQDRADYESQIKKLGLQDRVILRDEYIPNEQVACYFTAADVVALPYLSATQSGIVQICYHYNKPVIATDVGGLPEIVRDGETGFVVSHNDAIALAAALQRFYQENREASFSANIGKIKHHYSWDRMGEAIEQLCSGHQA